MASVTGVDTPLVSVLILTWNSRELIHDAVASALAQTVAGVEVVVLDNDSSDGTVREVERHFAGRVRIIQFERNLGYTGGYNRALALGQSPFVLLLNPDARLAPDFLEKALPAFDDPRVGIVAGRLMRADRVTVDSTGQFLGHSRRVVDRGYGQPWDPSRDQAGPVLSACGAAALYRREMVRDIADGADFFDPDFFAFHEDLEVGWRAWRAGWKAVHVPAALAVHLRAGGVGAGRVKLTLARSADVTFWAVRNRYLTLWRHDRIGALLVDLPFVLARELAVFGMLLLHRPAVLKRLWREREPFARARDKRQIDRRRKGVWGPWTDKVPPRGIGRLGRGGSGR